MIEIDTPVKVADDLIGNSLIKVPAKAAYKLKAPKLQSAATLQTQKTLREATCGNAKPCNFNNSFN